MNWRRLCHEQLSGLSPEDRAKIIIARRQDGKCTVGHIESITARNVVIRNGSYQVTLWFTEPRMFALVASPGFPEYRVGDPRLPLEAK